jgi:hypothetical protein
MMRMTTKENLTQLEQYFQQFRKNIIGINQDLTLRTGKNKMLMDRVVGIVPLRRN